MSRGPLLLDTITLTGTPIAEKIRLAARAGFAGVELRGAELDEWTGTGRPLAGLGRLIRESGLTAPAIVPEADLWGWHVDVASPAFREALVRFCAAARELGCRVLVFPVMTTEGSLDQATANYAILCDRLREWDLVPGLEFIGHIPKVPDLATAWQIVSAVGRPNSGIVCDLFHFYRGGSRLANLAAIPPEQLAIVHIDDAMDLPREQLVGSRHRLYPGQGILPLQAMLGTLVRMGYQGPYAVELFNPDYWAADPAEVSQTAYTTGLAVLERAAEEAAE